MAYGVDLIEAEVRKAVNLPVGNISQTECDGYWCEMIVHARPGQSGILKSVNIDPEIKNKYLKVVDLSVQGHEPCTFTRRIQLRRKLRNTWTKED